ncbi:MAG: hypothetical protein J5643_11585 [Lachnospiraceae bacterium]|nr:hypothetical protein [Lachnospiraceae bacterium]
MKTKLLSCLLLALLLAFLCGCSADDKEKGNENSSLCFEYSDWVNPNQKNIFSTEQNLIQKDMVSEKPVTAEWKISGKDRAAIEKMIRDYQLPGLIEEYKRYEEGLETYYMSSPEISIEFCFTLDNHEYRIATTQAMLNFIPKDMKIHDLTDFFAELKNTLCAQKAYQSLPKAKSSYQ